MGQSYSSATAPDGNIRAGIDIPELEDISYEKSLGSARFLKTIRARHADGLVVVKIFAKPLASVPLMRHRRQLLREQEALENVPNAFTYQKVVETERAVYLIRQYLYSSLYDRISTRPFLEEIEKRWIAFQLLCGLRDCHAQGIHHGDIKTENVLVTSWNWIYLADFAPFKPTYLPADNPADFSYFFDTSGRRICYVAPERFLDAAHKREHDGITDEMDIFSLGCVIAELFLEGTPLFTLSQLFKYRSGEYDPTPQLAKIEDSEIRGLILHMISPDPSKRFSAEKYLNEWRRKAFPEYFYSFLHQYIGFVTDRTSGRTSRSEDDNDPYGRADYRIDRIYHDFDKISFFLGFEPNEELGKRTSIKDDIIPVHLDIPNYQRHSPAVRRRHISHDDGTLIFLSLVASSLRNTARTGARVRGCDVMLAFAERITDEAKMDRCLPYLVSLLGDESEIVQVAVLRTITQLMELVEIASPTNSHVFPDYILPKLQPFASSKSALVRATYASCLASLANSAQRFLDMTQALRVDGVLPTTDPEAEAGSDTATAQALYDTSRDTLVVYFQEHAKTLLTDSDSAVRRAFLRSVSRLCVFFGRSKANDIILSHLNTYLNDKDWILRCAFFETITGIATYLGSVALEDYIMPLMVQSLTDPEEFVVEKVLSSLASMAELGLFQRSIIWEMVDIVGRFTMHPNIWIRQGAVGFIAACTKWLAPADIHCIIFPLVMPFMRTKMVDLSALNLLENLKKPLTRNVFEMAVIWAMQSRDGLFWRDAEKKHTFVFGSIDGSIPRVCARDVQAGNIRIPKNKEDDIWLNKLINLGMAPEDEWKIVCLREYIWRMAQSKPRLLSESTHSLLSATISLQELKITPRTIFFDENESFFKRATAGSAPDTPARPPTIADALMDASRTIDKSLKKSASNLHLKRIATDIQRQQRNADSGQNSPVSGSTTPIQTVQPDTSLSSASPTKSLQIPVVRINGGSESPGSPNSIENGVISGLRRQKSSSSLLNRGAPSKATSETSNISATAVGRVETPISRDSNNRMADVESNEPLFKFRAAHSYDGNDPHILHLLDTMYLQNYPSDIVEFGPAIVPAQRRQPIKKSNGRLAGGYWKPEANFVASFGEHHDSINRVVVAPDHAFFVTASDDGTVKIWDTTRLEKNVAFRARQTYKHSNTAKVKALCFVENTRCFVSGATDGSIHVVKVEFSTSAAKYGKLRVMREYQLPGPQEYAVWMEHFKSDNNSILLIATNASNIHALDLRTMKILYTLKNPIYHGTPTCFCIDKKHNWLVVGTSHGILDMWDLRYQLPLKAWGIPGSMPIHKLQVHPTKGRGRWIIVAGGTGQNELTVWDCDKTQCREVYRAGSSGGGNSKDWSNPKNYEAWNVGDESPEVILSRFATSLNHLDSTAAVAAGGGGGVDRGPRTFLAEQDFVEGDIDTRVVPSFIIMGGVDHKVRFWNTVRVEASCVVSGLDVDEPKPTYVCLQPAPHFVVYTEKPSHSDTESVTSVGSGGIRGFLGVSGSSTSPSTPSSSSSKRKNAVAAAGGGGGAGGRTSRSTVISQQQQALLKSHLDTVMDVAFLEVPYGMIVSVDRGGMVFLYQ